MGTTPSIHLQVPPDFNYFTIILASTDCLRILFAPDNVIEEIETLLQSYWVIQKKSIQGGFVEFKIEGMPWFTYGKHDLNVKSFICDLLKVLYANGWRHLASCDLEQTGNGKNHLIFERCEPKAVNLACLSLNDNDKIRLLAPLNITSHIEQVIKQNWKGGIQSQQQFGPCWEFKLKGNPWLSISAEQPPVNTLMLVNGIFSRMSEIGWHFACSIRSCKNDYNFDSLYFIDAPPVVIGFKPDFFAISLDLYDHVTFVELPVEMQSDLSSFIRRTWPNGIQYEKKDTHAYDVKLKGVPWLVDLAEESVRSRKILCDLLQFISSKDYTLHATCDLTRNSTSRCTFVFRPRTDAKLVLNPINSSSSLICVCFAESSLIRLINCHSECLVELLRQAIRNGWPNGIQNEANVCDSHEFTLKGSLFSQDGASQVFISMTVLHILSAFQSKAYRLVTSAGICNRNYSGLGKQGLHSLIFEKVEI